MTRYTLSSFTIDSIVDAICAEHGVERDDVFGSLKHPAVRARHDALARLRAITNPDGQPRYSLSIIGAPFHMSETSVSKALSEMRKARPDQAPRREPPPKLSAAEVQARSSLSWLYGPDRAALIIAGQDPASNADVALWRKLGAEAA